jgi:hypothetical protein
MKKYDLLFYVIYNLSGNNSVDISNFKKRIKVFRTILILSFFEFINFMSFILLLHLPNEIIYFRICFILIYIINYYYFFTKRRFVFILEISPKMDSKENYKNRLIVVSYFILSLGIFFLSVIIKN